MNNRRRNNSQSKSSGNRSHNQSNRRRRNQRQNRHRGGGPKLSPIEKTQKSYYNLLEKHLEARKKYFELFHRADPRQLQKLEKSFYNSLYELRNFVENLKPEAKEEFEKKYDLRMDHTYTSNHELPVEEEHVSHDGSFDDPHLLKTQEMDFSSDTEESSGSLDDYKAYKGIS